jgi:hypothetical protein
MGMTSEQDHRPIAWHVPIKPVCPYQSPSILLRFATRSTTVLRGLEPRSVKGQKLTSDSEFLMSAFLPIADVQTTACDVRFVPILLQKSFWGDERKF